ncbi:MAG: phage/plasmid primase, P4 family [Rhodospirillaceae bacterium]
MDIQNETAPRMVPGGGEVVDSVRNIYDTTTIPRLAALFNPAEHAHGVSKPTGEKDARGKVKAEYKTVKKPISETAWQKHLDNEYCLVPIPIRDDSTAGFGAIDVDVYPLDLIKLTARVEEAHLPLVVCRSKSRGAHLFLFLKEPHDAEAVQTKLASWAEALGYPGVEVFPKQTKLVGDDTGNGIAAPYKNDGRSVSLEYALSPDDGHALYLDEFLDLAEERRVDPADLAGIVPKKHYPPEGEEAVPARTNGGTLPLPADVPGDLAGAPPCLQHWATTKVPLGTQNDVLFDFGVYAKKAFPDNWTEKLEDWNQRFLDPQGDPAKLRGLIRQLSKEGKDYLYKAKCQGPQCNPTQCRIQEYGRGRLPRTDVGNGQRLVVQHGADLLYCYPWKSWLVWDGARFRPDDHGEIVRRAKDTAASIYQEAAAVAKTDPKEGERLGSFAASSQSKKLLDAMVWAAQSEVPAAVDDLDADANLLNLKSGTLELDTCTHREHRREDKLTKLAPITLDGNATCPTWDKFLDDIFAGDRDLIQFMQRSAGYSLTGSVAEEVFWILYGKGRNGKTTFVRTMQWILGDYAKSIRVESLLATDRNRAGAPNEDVAGLKGIRLAVASEPDSQFRLNEALIKGLTGGDRLEARKLRQQLFEFDPTHKLWLSTNHEPEIRGLDEGIWRRVILVPFNVTIAKSKEDRHLKEKLAEELPGILNWCVDGLREYNKQGLNPPPQVLKATADYRKKQDKLAAFLEAECEVGDDKLATVADMTRTYQRFQGADAFKSQTFNKMMMDRGFVQTTAKIGKKPTKVWKGVRLVNPAEAYDERNPPPHTEVR